MNKNDKYENEVEKNKRDNIIENDFWAESFER